MGWSKPPPPALSDWVGVNGDSLPEPLVGGVNTNMVAMSAAAHYIGYRSADELASGWLRLKRTPASWSCNCWQS